MQGLGCPLDPSCLALQLQGTAGKEKPHMLQTVQNAGEWTKLQYALEPDAENSKWPSFYVALAIICFSYIFCGRGV